MTHLLRMQTDFSASTYGSSDGAASEAKEGKVAKAIESITAKVPSDVYLWAATAAMVGSLVTQIIGVNGGRKTPKRAPVSTFIGQWVPSLLLFGVYNKLVKQNGSDRQTA